MVVDSPGRIADERASFPCSLAQRRFWVLDQLDPGNSALNIAVRWRLEGDLDTAILERAFRLLIARHDSLRTYFQSLDGEPEQVVVATVPFRIPVIDLSGLREADALVEAERIARLEARTSFELTSPPLIRVSCIRVQRRICIILVTVHHAVCDGWSVGILAHEMGLIYAALSAGRLPQLPELAASYGEYSLWQAQLLSNSEFGETADFWKTSLQGMGHFELVTDRPRPPVQTNKADIHSLLLDRALTDGLATLARREGCTLFALAATALLVTLSRHSGETDIAIGTQVMGRQEPELEPLVGLFINTLVLRNDLSGNPKFLELLAAVRDRMLDAFEHQSMPMERLIELLRPKRDLSRNPLFSINFIFQRAFVSNEDFGPVKLVDIPSYSAGALYDLNFFMVERPEGWRASCEFNTDLFDLATVSSFLSHFVNVLRGAVDFPMREISSLRMLEQADEQMLVSSTNQTQRDYPRGLTVSQLVQAQCDRAPRAVALVCGGRSYSYAELDAASTRVAKELLLRKLAPSSRVGVLLERSVDLVVALLAVLKSGSAYIPLDPAYPQERLSYVVENSRAAAVITRSVLSERIGASTVPMLLLDTDAAAIARQTTTPLPDIGLADDPAYLIYTSGSTGTPKGVVIGHRAVVNFLCAMRDRPGLSASDTLLAVTTMSFDIAVLEIFLPLIVGARIVLASEEEAGDGRRIAELLESHSVTVMQATPATWQILIESDWHGGAQMKLLCGGETLPRNLAEALLERCAELWNMYGPTETTVWSSVIRVRSGAGPVLIGAPIANTQFYVLDANQQLAPFGATGELCIGGDGVAIGYWDLPEQTQAKFIPDTFGPVDSKRLYRTGDLVRMDREGHLEFFGRTDHQIKLRGFRIELGEIEAVLGNHSHVSATAVIPGTDTAGEPAIWAYVALSAGAEAQHEAIKAALRASLSNALPVYMQPAAITVLERLPRTPNGKIDRKALPVPAVTRAAPEAAEHAAQLTETESRLVRIWAAVLGLESIHPTDNFFELGGHSLLAARLLARIETQFGQRLSLATLFQAPTVAAQAALLAGGEVREYDFRQVVKLQANGSNPPLIVINNTGIFYLLAKRLGPLQPFTSLQIFDPGRRDSKLPGSIEEIAAEYVKLIRSVHPQGPYSLMGWCVAGVLAFEVARQLQQTGDQVPVLVLIDTWVPGYLKRLPKVRSLLADYSHRLKLIAIDWGRASSGQQTWGRFLNNRFFVRRLRRLFGSPVPEAEPEVAFVTRGLSPRQFDQWLLGYLEDTVKRYQPKMLDGRLTIFRSKEQPSGRFLDVDMGWGAFAAGGSEVVVIDGDHFTMHRDPGVAQMADYLSTAIARIPPDVRQ